MFELKKATRPGILRQGREVRLASNFYAFRPAENLVFYLYDLVITPEVAAEQMKLREKIVRRCGRTLSEHIGKFVFNNTQLYGSLSSHEEEVMLTCNFEGVDYTLTVRFLGEADSQSQEQMKSGFTNRFFKSMQSRLKLCMIGRKFFNPDAGVELSSYKLTVWPGYTTAVSDTESGSMVCIDISHRVLRTNTVLSQLNELRNRSDTIPAAKKMLVGCSVLTLYNCKSYRVDDVDFNKNPRESFVNEKGETQTFKQYYETRWTRTITDDAQPLLLVKEKDRELYLVPEFCVLTGLTDDMRADFNVMKALATATKKDPHERLAECTNLIQRIKYGTKTKEELSNWRVNLGETPSDLTGHVLPAGQIDLAKGVRFNINENMGSFDRDVQKAMFEQPRLDEWGVLYCEADNRLAESMMENLYPVIQTYSVQCTKPKQVVVPSARWTDWDRILRGLPRGVQMVICILPGQRGKATLYDDLKRLTFGELGIPSQVILTGTLKKDKGLRSVLNKVIMQINAKVGGVPWCVSGLPFTDQPTMVVGVDIFQKKGSFYVLGVVGSTDRNFAKYVTAPKIMGSLNDLQSSLVASVKELVNAFKTSNGREPTRFVVFRNGVSDSQIQGVLQIEVLAFGQAFEALLQEGSLTQPPTLLYNVVSKRVDARFYAAGGSQLSNPPLGTCIDTVITKSNSYDFYLMPAKATQGAMTPTYFHVVFDNTGTPCFDLQSLAYRLCFAYYNWSGSIRVPAPCQYAHKLAYQLGERANQFGPPVPSPRWQETRSLYFL